MQKITEIEETYTATTKNDIDGVVTETSQQATRFRTVPYVEGGPRFGHYLLDQLCLIVFQFMFGTVLGAFLGFTGQMAFLEDPDFALYSRLFNWIILQPGYYFIFEFAMQATPGKAILKRVVVDEYGNKPTAKEIFIRSVSRIVPFEAFSCLGVVGWHDSWSHTFVIRKKDLEELKLLQSIHNLSPEASADPEI